MARVAGADAGTNEGAVVVLREVREGELDWGEWPWEGGPPMAAGWRAGGARRQGRALDSANSPAHANTPRHPIQPPSLPALTMSKTQAPQALQ